MKPSPANTIEKYEILTNDLSLASNSNWKRWALLIKVDCHIFILKDIFLQSIGHMIQLFHQSKATLSHIFKACKIFKKSQIPETVINIQLNMLEKLTSRTML